MKLSELAVREPQHIMVFGASKSGKSTLASELALSGYNLKWFSMDNGHRILYKLPKEVQEERIDITVIPDTRDFPVAIDTCRKLIKGDEVTLCNMHAIVGCSVCKKNNLGFTRYCFKENGPKDVVVLDHITQLTDSCMSLICKGKPVDYKPKLDDWGSLRFYMMELCSNIQNAPFNIVCIAQEMESEMEDGSKKITPQVGSREFGKSVGSFFDHIVYCQVKNLAHKAGSATTYSASVLTGSRSDVSIEKLDKPSLVPFFDGSIPKPPKNGEEQVKKLAAQVAVTSSTQSSTTPVPQPVAAEPPIPLKEEKKEEEKKEAKKPEGQQEMSPAERAKALLANMRR